MAAYTSLAAGVGAGGGVDRRPGRAGAAGDGADRDHAGRRGARRGHPGAASAAPGRGRPRARGAGVRADDPGGAHDDRPRPQTGDAARARGLERDPRARLVPLVVRSVAHARATGEALDARGIGD